MNDNDEILIAIRRIIRAADLHSQELMRRSGLTAPQLLVMQAIAREGSTATNLVARRIHVSHATVTRIIDRLVAAGLVRRDKSSDDRRVVLVSLTDAGTEKIADAPEPLQADFLRRYGELADWEQHMLKSSLLRIAQMMDADKLDASPILQSGTFLEPESVVPGGETDPDYRR